MDNLAIYLEKSDNELILLSKLDSLAEETLIKRYRPLTYKIARKYFLVGGDIDDLLQEGTLGLWKAIKEFDVSKNTSFFTYAKLCIDTKIKDSIKISQSLNKQFLNKSLSINNENQIIEIPSDENPLEDFLERENFDNFYLIIKKLLTPLQFDVIKLYLDGYSYQEISYKLNISAKKVDNELFLAKNKIKKSKDKFVF